MSNRNRRNQETKAPELPKMVMVDGVMVNEAEYLASLPPEETKVEEPPKVEDAPPNPVREAAAAPKLKIVGGNQYKGDGGFGAKAVHYGCWFMATEGKHRKAGDPGAAGLEWLHEEYVASFEEFAKRFPLSHLNWDINRGWVKFVSAEDAAEMLGTGEEEGEAEEEHKAEEEPAAEEPAAE